ncbi:MAG: CoA ester lyase [Chloroflexi bacterium]|nr:CoA ester lyase [Chloroflexota bacterium]
MTAHAAAPAVCTTLFVPGIRWSMLERAARSTADAVCLDLEDSVPAGQRDEARAQVVRALQSLDFAGKRRLVRVNAVASHETYRDLIAIADAAGAPFDGVMLPKVEHPGDIMFVDRLLAQIEGQHGSGRYALEVQIESAAGWLDVAAIARASSRIAALIFGPGDFAASLGAPLANIGEPDAADADYPGHRWHAAMLTIVAAARAVGAACYDGPYAAFRDEAGLIRSARTARALGFDGKQCIHPGQLAAVAGVFVPTEHDVRWAQRVIDALQQATAARRGAVALDGRMLDAASIRLARQVLARQR